MTVSQYTTEKVAALLLSDKERQALLLSDKERQAALLQHLLCSYRGRTRRAATPKRLAKRHRPKRFLSYVKEIMRPT
jgi:hypothetical protein